MAPGIREIDLSLTLEQVLAGDADIGDRLPIPTDTFQIFDECRGE